MPDAVRALFLPDRCDFTLLHCGEPMAYVQSRSTWQGQFPHGTSTTENEYRCARCGSVLALKVVEPDEPPGA